MEPIEIDGSAGEGGGQVLRTSLSLAAIFHKPVKITKIRAGRKTPGLKPQHLQSVLVAAKITGGNVQGANLGSTEVDFDPGPLPSKFSDLIDTGTAGSISLIAQTIIPISIFGGVILDLEIRGGTEVPNSPTIDYLRQLVVPVYERLGAGVELALKRRGYFPRGGGAVSLRCSRIREPTPIELVSNETSPINILSVSRALPSHVSKRQAEIARRTLESSSCKIGKVEFDNLGGSSTPGSSVLIYEVNTSTFVGASSLGERGKRAERVGEEAANYFLKEIGHQPNVDSHLADMLVTLLSCVPGTSAFKTSVLTSHFSTNCIVARRLTGSEVRSRRSGESWIVEVDGSPEKPN